MFWCVHLELLSPVEWLEDRMSMFPNDYSMIQNDLRYQEGMQHALEQIRRVTQLPAEMVHARNMYANLWSSYPNSEPWWPSSLEKPPPDDLEDNLRRTKVLNDEYDAILQTTLKAYMPKLVDHLFSMKPLLASLWEKGKREDGWMNGITTRKASEYVFEVMALETPMQWEEVKAVPGALFELPKVIVPYKTVVAKNMDTAKKECWAEASKVEKVDVKRLEVLARPFLG